MSDESHNFELEVDVDGVHPNNVDAVSFLQYAAIYLEGLQLVARLSDGELTFTGLEIVDKCVAVRSRANNADLSWNAVGQLDNFVAGTVAPPRKYRLISHTRALIASRERFVSTLPKPARKTVRTVVRVDEHVSQLRLPPEPAADQFRYRTIETIRAKVERLAGAELKVRLVPVLGRPFIVELSSEKQALEVRHYWLDEVDVDVEVERDLGGEILKGRLLRFNPLEEGSGVELWRSWVDENEPELIPDEVGDV